MRIIKFRVWNKKTNSWVHEPGQEVNLFGESILLGAFMPVPFEELDDCVPLQFTGMLDSEGKEIYEGDILEVPNFWMARPSDPETWVSPVVFDDGSFSCGVHILNGLLRRQVKVVGNIFEHKNLLPDHEKNHH